MEKTKDNFFKHNGMTHYLEQKAKGDIPYIYPLNLFHDTKHQSLSEKNRYVKLTNMFSNLRYVIENNPEHENRLVKEVKTPNFKLVYDEKWNLR